MDLPHLGSQNAYATRLVQEVYHNVAVRKGNLLPKQAIESLVNVSETTISFRIIAIKGYQIVQ